MTSRREALNHLVALGLIASAPQIGWAKDGKSKEQLEKERAEIRKMVKETLQRLYKLQPSANSAIAKSAGYAVFSNFGMKILFAGSGTGKGIAFEQAKKREVFMKMIELQAGLGLGVKKFSVVFVFDKPNLVTEFIESGWEAGAQATAAGTYDGKGGALAGAVAVKPGVWMYQMTNDGLALELTAKGTKYYKNDELN